MKDYFIAAGTSFLICGLLTIGGADIETDTALLLYWLVLIFTRIDRIVRIISGLKLDVN